MPETRTEHRGEQLVPRLLLLVETPVVPLASSPKSGLGYQVAFLYGYMEEQDTMTDPIQETRLRELDHDFHGLRVAPGPGFQSSASSASREVAGTIRPCHS